MKSLHLFAGIGGGILADVILGHEIVGAVEIVEYCRKVLQQHQRDGFLNPFPVFEDVRTFDCEQFKGQTDLICGGFPCQDISAAGRGAGINGNKSRLFYELIRVCGIIRPRFIFLENSPLITSRGLDTVLKEIAKIGYDAEWGTLSAGAVGAPHLRNRWWAVCKRQDVRGGEARHEVGKIEARWWKGNCDTDRERIVSDAESTRLERVCRGGVSIEAGESRPLGECTGTGTFTGTTGGNDTIRRGDVSSYCDREREVCDADGGLCKLSPCHSSTASTPSTAFGYSGAGNGTATVTLCGRAQREADRGLSGTGLLSYAESAQRKRTDDLTDAVEVSRTGLEHGRSVCRASSDLDGTRREEDVSIGTSQEVTVASLDYRNVKPGWWEVEPGVRRVVDEFPGRVDAIRGLGNAQVPVCAAMAFYLLLKRFCEE